jgi:hypothetical protein
VVEVGEHFLVRRHRRQEVLSAPLFKMFWIFHTEHFASAVRPLELRAKTLGLAFS